MENNMTHGDVLPPSGHGSKKLIFITIVIAVILLGGIATYLFFMKNKNQGANAGTAESYKPIVVRRVYSEEEKQKILSALSVTGTTTFPRTWTTSTHGSVGGKVGVAQLSEIERQKSLILQALSTPAPTGTTTVVSEADKLKILKALSQ